jgi:hypothetical protein
MDNVEYLPPNASCSNEMLSDLTHFSKTFVDSGHQSVGSITCNWRSTSAMGSLDTQKRTPTERGGMHVWKQALAKEGIVAEPTAL